MLFFKKLPEWWARTKCGLLRVWVISNVVIVALLKFNKGSRENFHSHAFNAFTWFLFGDMMEERFIGKSGQQPIIEHTRYKFGLKPKFTSKENLHLLLRHKTSWSSIRGHGITMDNLLPTVLFRY